MNNGEKYTIESVDQPEWSVIGQGINDYNQQQVGEDNAQSLCFVLRSESKEVIGGVIGATYWNWLHLDLMWIRVETRGSGYGHRLLMPVGEEARRRGATNAYLDTFSFQALDFYKKHGYQVFGKLGDFPTGYQRYFLTKQL